MNTVTTPTPVSIPSLRARKADFFKMEVAHAMPRPTPKDRNPLRRTFHMRHDHDLYVGNQNMCRALWQLMQRF